MRDRSHCSWNSAVHVMNVVYVNVVVIVVGDVRDVGDARVRDVDVLEVIPAGAIVRYVRLTVAQREPAHTTTTKRNSNAPVRAANPGDQRGRVTRAHIDRPRHPAPVSARVNPAAVVEGGKAPRSVINPRPAPGRNPDP